LCRLKFIGSYSINVNAYNNIYDFIAVCFSNLSKPVVSATLLRTFHVPVKYMYYAYGVSSLSISDRHKLLLVGDKHSSKVPFVTAEGEYVATVVLPQGNQLSDAAWTPIRDNIVYTTITNNDACVMSVSGELIARTQTYFSTSRSISVSSDNIIYIALGYNGIVLSRDDGMTWSRLLPSPTNTPVYAIKVSSAYHTDELWLLESTFSSVNYGLRAYKIDSQSGHIL
jgi:hypothetical protein